jgi:hypothetical protein
LLSVNVARDPAVEAFNVIKLPDVPDAVKAVIVCVVPEVSVMVAG